MLNYQKYSCVPYNKFPIEWFDMHYGLVFCEFRKYFSEPAARGKMRETQFYLRIGFILLLTTTCFNITTLNQFDVSLVFWRKTFSWWIRHAFRLIWRRWLVWIGLIIHRHSRLCRIWLLLLLGLNNCSSCSCGLRYHIDNTSTRCRSRSCRGTTTAKHDNCNRYDDGNDNTDNNNGNNPAG